MLFETVEGHALSVDLVGVKKKMWREAPVLLGFLRRHPCTYALQKAQRKGLEVLVKLLFL
jgi:hypothetical protein